VTLGILLVGGRGTRLAPITSEIPKPMLPIAGKPVTEHQINAAKQAGVTTLVLATSYLSEIFTPYFGDGSKWGIDLRYAVEKEPLGTGGAIANAASLFDAGPADEPVVIFNGDVLSKHNLSAQIAFHQEKSADVTLHLIEVDDARAFGCVPTSEDGQVEAFLEKMDNPVTGWINAGCYVFTRSIINSIPRNTVISVERETFPSLIEKKSRIFGYKEAAYWLDIGTPAALFKGSSDYVDGSSFISPGADVDATAEISDGSAIGSAVKVGAASRIKNSIICEGARIGAGVKVERSFIAPGAHLSDGAEIIERYVSTSENLPIIF
jgi:mannose-1-phosphate guanylyltransferase